MEIESTVRSRTSSPGGDRGGPSLWAALSPAARLATITLVCFSVVALIGHDRVPRWGFYLGGNLLGLVLLVIIFRPLRKPLPRLLEELRQTTPLLAYWWLYREVEFLSLVFVHDWQNDVALGWDLALFGELPNLFAHRHETLWLTEWLSASYMLYVPALVVVPVAFSLRGEPAERQRVLYQITLAFSLCYIGFLLMPLQGPRDAIADLFQAPLSGWIFHRIVSVQIEYGLVHYGGCLPSAHCAAATVLMAGVWRLGRWPFVAGLLIIAPIFLATIYLRLHYAVDVLGGWVIAGLVLWVTRKSWFGKTSIDRL